MEIIASPVEMPLVTHLKKCGDSNGGTVIVGCHDGSWHADDLLSIAILAEALPEYDISVIRSRDRFMLERAHVVVDVPFGDNKFDHHGRNTKYYDNGIPYAACGLVLDAVEPNRILRNQLNWQLIYAVSAKDNGYDGRMPQGLPPSKFDWVGTFYPTWEEKTMSDGELLIRFYSVLEIVRMIYRRVRAHAIASLHVDGKLDACPREVGKKFIMLQKGGIPWIRWAYNHREVLGAIYPDDVPGRWVVRMAREYGSRCNRASFPREWCGLEDDALRATSGISSALFCHSNGFLMSFSTKEGALHAARVVAALNV